MKNEIREPLTDEAIKNILNLIQMDDETFYKTYISTSPKHEQQSFVEEFPEFLHIFSKY